MTTRLDVELEIQHLPEDEVRDLQKSGLEKAALKINATILIP